MTFRTLMVNLELGQTNAGILEVTRKLALKFDASVIGVAEHQPIQIIYGEGPMYGQAMAQEADDTKKEMVIAEAEFRDALGNEVRETHWRSQVTLGPISRYLSAQARSADLIIASADAGSWPGSPRQLSLADLVMQCGRPVLVVPVHRSTIGFETALVAWRDTRESRRAIVDALPLLHAMTEVTILEMSPPDSLPVTRLRLEDVGRWFTSHGIKVALDAVASTGDDARQLESIIAERAPDVIVAGAYGHTRMREWVFGGVTKDLLLCSKRCTLLSH